MQITISRVFRMAPRTRDFYIHAKLRELTGKKGEKVIAAARPAYIRLLQCTARDIETIPHAHAFRMITFASINLDHRESNTKSPTLWMKYF